MSRHFRATGHKGSQEDLAKAKELPCSLSLVIYEMLEEQIYFPF